MQTLDNRVVQPLSLPKLRDQLLAEELHDRLRADRRTAHLELSIKVDGAVAHVTGEVASPTELALVRSLLRQQAGLYAVWDLLSLPGQQLQIADIGCGGQKQYPWAVGVDRISHPGIDVIADLEERLPFEDNSFDHLFAIHVLEHIHNLLGLMLEMHRILRPDGVLHVMVPHWQHVNAVADPTHCRFMDVQTFKYFCGSNPNVKPWRPLIASSSEDTVFVDLQPIKDGSVTRREDLARWFK